MSKTTEIATLAGTMQPGGPEVVHETVPRQPGVIRNPGVQCPYCGFFAGLDGEWEWRDGGLVFSVNRDMPKPWRGPDLEHCSECGGDFAGIAVDTPQCMDTVTLPSSVP